MCFCCFFQINLHTLIVWVFFHKNTVVLQWWKHMFSSTFNTTVNLHARALVILCLQPYVPPGGRFKNTYELLNLRALKISKLHKNHIFQCMGKIILCGISKGTFEIPHKISYPYIERCVFYSQVKIQELFDLRAHKCFWNAPPRRTPSH